MRPSPFSARPRALMAGALACEMTAHNKAVIVSESVSCTFSSRIGLIRFLPLVAKVSSRSVRVGFQSQSSQSEQTNAGYD